MSDELPTAPKPERAPSRSKPPLKIATEDGRVDLDVLMALPAEKRLYRASPPPPPPPRRSNPPERSSLGPVVEDLEAAPELEFDDRPTPVTPLPAFKGEPAKGPPAEEKRSRRASLEKNETGSHRAARHDANASSRRGVLGVSIALGTLALGGLAIVMNPHPQPKAGMAQDLQPLSQLGTSLAPIATTLEDTAPAPPPPPPAVAAEPKAPDAPLQIVGDGSMRRSPTKGSKTARPTGSSSPKTETSAKAKDMEAPPHADGSDVPAAAATAEPTEPSPTLGPFDPNAARLAMQGPKGAAFNCFASATEGGVARLTVTFMPNGQLTNAVVMGPPFGGTPVGACISSKFAGLSVAPFEGEPVTVAMSLAAPPPVDVSKLQRNEQGDVAPEAP